MPRRKTVPDRPHTPLPMPPKTLVKDLYMGCDPGSGGAFAILNKVGMLVHIIRMDWEEAVIGEALRAFRHRINFAIIEKVHSGVFSPDGRKQGTKSAFTFGENYGVMHGMISVCNIRHDYMRPLKWQTAMDCRTGGDKHVSRAAAQRMFPYEKITLRNADAILIAELARRTAIDRGWA